MTRRKAAGRLPPTHGVAPDAPVREAVATMIREDIGSAVKDVAFENRLLKQYIRNWPQAWRPPALHFRKSR